MNKASFLLLILAYFSLSSCGEEENSYSYENGIGLIQQTNDFKDTHLSVDWDMRIARITAQETIWNFCQEHSDARSLVLEMFDECKDSRGNVSTIKTSIIFDEKDIQDYATYQDLTSFYDHCFEVEQKFNGWEACPWLE
ncbi:MAG: hypothetical protein CL845_09780 [Crocinitomicaceae bacterium]|nr:hypothetical protein [Crocinitomicaceae bacterium]